LGGVAISELFSLFILFIARAKQRSFDKFTDDTLISSGFRRTEARRALSGWLLQGRFFRAFCEIRSVEYAKLDALARDEWNLACHPGNDRGGSASGLLPGMLKLPQPRQGRDFPAPQPLRPCADAIPAIGLRGGILFPIQLTSYAFRLAIRGILHPVFQGRGMGHPLFGAVRTLGTRYDARMS